jgi:hypothetical protein
MWRTVSKPTSEDDAAPDRQPSVRVIDHQQEPMHVTEQSSSSSTATSNQQRMDGAKNDLLDHSLEDDSDMNLSMRERISNSLGSYITIEAIWQITLFAACYKYRPLVRLSRSERAHQVLHKVQTTIFGTNNTPSTKSVPFAGGGAGKTKKNGGTNTTTNTTADDLSSDAVSSSFKTRLQSFGICSSSIVQRLPGGSRTLFAASEWFFFNKVIGIPLWPTKILLAGWITKKLEEQHVIQKRKTMRRHNDNVVQH